MAEIAALFGEQVDRQQDRPDQHNGVHPPAVQRADHTDPLHADHGAGIGHGLPQVRQPS